MAKPARINYNDGEEYVGQGRGAYTQPDERLGDQDPLDRDDLQRDFETHWSRWLNTWVHGVFAAIDQDRIR